MRLSDRGVCARIRLLAGVILAVPSLAISAPGLSGQEPDCGDRAVLRAVVLDESESIPIPGATLVLRWTDTDRGRRPVREEAGPDGSLSLCAPPDARQATVWAELGDVSSEEAVVAIVAGTLHEVELRLRSGPVSTGRLIGQVRDARTNRPVNAATVALVDRTEMGVTNRQGGFVLSGVPVGVYELSVRHLGYAPLIHPVWVSRGVTTEIEVGLVPDPVEMEPLVATTTRSRRLEVKGFYERKYWGELVGTGLFYTADDIDRRRPALISHMIADGPGIRLECGLRARSCDIVNTRLSAGFTSGACPMSVYVDGMGVGSNVDEIVGPADIAGVEIYRGAASVPGEFAGSDSRCGVVVVWTQ